MLKASSQTPKALISLLGKSKSSATSRKHSFKNSRRKILIYFQSLSYQTSRLPVPLYSPNPVDSNQSPPQLVKAQQPGLTINDLCIVALTIETNRNLPTRSTLSMVTIADLAQSQNIQPPHLLEAIQYRSLDRLA